MNNRRQVRFFDWSKGMIKFARGLYQQHWAPNKANSFFTSLTLAVRILYRTRLRLPDVAATPKHILERYIVFYQATTSVHGKMVCHMWLSKQSHLTPNCFVSMTVTTIINKIIINTAVGNVTVLVLSVPTEQMAGKI